MQETKDGIWFGPLPKHWAVGRIGKLYTERKTKVSDADFAPLSVTKMGVVPQLATAAKTDAHDDRKLVLKGDFAINSRSDRRGSCGISDYEGSASLINTILTPREEMNPGYYNWLFHTAEFADEFYKWGHGIVDDLWTTNWSDMKRIAVPVPSLEIQLRIADFLDAKCAEIDSVLEKTKASIEEYKKLKQSVITEAVTKGVRGKRPMKDSGVEWIGEIPEEWKTNRLAPFAKEVKKPNSEGQETNALQFKLGTIISKSCGDSKYHPETLETYNQIEIGDIVINGLNLMFDMISQRVAIAQEKGVITSAYIVLRPYGITNEYLTYLLKAFDHEKVFHGMGKGLRLTLSYDEIKRLLIPIPPYAEQQEIAAYLDSKCAAIDAIISSKEALVAELETYKKSLIYEYVTGKKEVPAV